MNSERHIAGRPMDLLADCSFEITGKDMATLNQAAPFIMPGSQVSITFLPGEKPAARIEAALRLKALGFVPVPHIAARRIGSANALDMFLGDLADQVGCQHVFVIAGDAAEPSGPFPDALSIIRSGKLEKAGIRSVGIAGYPEGHPSIDESTCWRALFDKVTALGERGMDCQIVTQFAFDAAPVLDWLLQVRSNGVAAPVRVGLPGPANVGTLLRFAARCGVGASAKVMAKYGLSITRLLDTAGPDILLREFAAHLRPEVHGAVRFHLYPFGGMKKAASWCTAYNGIALSNQ